MSWSRYTGWGSMIIIAGMPFHALAAVAAGHFLGTPWLWPIWKELLIISMVAAIAWGLRSEEQRQTIAHRLRQLGPLWWLVAAYVALSISVTLLLGTAGETARLVGAKTNLAFLVLFLIAAIASSQYFRELGQKILLAASGAVALFMIAQNTFLDPDFLVRFGYGPLTVPPYLDYGSLRRFPSTLGGANQLGAFLLLPIVLSLKLWWQKRGPYHAILIAMLSAALFFTYSRSAYLGALVALGIVIWLQGSRRIKTGLIALVLVAAVGILWQLPRLADSPLVVRGGLAQGTPDAEHLQAVSEGARLLIERPLGSGLGSAGPASFHAAEPIITENYYLQIGLEAGVAGLMLFLAINIAVALKLWQKRSQLNLAIPLLAALAGISIVNLFLHGWADSTTALTYWSLTGLTLGDTEGRRQSV